MHFARASVFAVSADVLDVTAAAEALHIKEFPFFRVAFDWWFGRTAEDREIERLFVSYLKTERAPHWVRQFAREILNRRAQGRLDPSDFGLPPVPPSDLPGPRTRMVLEVLYALAAAVAIIVLEVGIHG